MLVVALTRWSLYLCDRSVATVCRNIVVTIFYTVLFLIGVEDYKDLGRQNLEMRIREMDETNDNSGSCRASIFVCTCRFAPVNQSW
jgi:hypothetical protein